MNVRNSIIRRKRIEHLKKIYNCDEGELLRNHRDMLTGCLVGQAQYMFHEKNKRYFRKDENLGVKE